MRKIALTAQGLAAAGAVMFAASAAVLAIGPAGVSSPIVTFAGNPPGAPRLLASPPPGFPVIPPALSRGPLIDAGPSVPPTAGLSPGNPPQPTPPGDRSGPTELPTTVCFTCGFIPPPPYQPIPPTNNIVACANVTCS